jgi:hypothetical protein
MDLPRIAVRILFVCAAVALGAGRAQAQTAQLRGAVKNAATGAPVSAASVFMVGTSSGANTNLDGKYTITGAPTGVHDVRVTADGYTTKVIPEVELKDGETRVLNIALDAIVGDAYTIEDVVVSAARVLSSDFALLSTRQQAITIGDGISAEQIAKSPDATSGDALKRVTGLSIVDNKYVFVRGVTDRYNATSLNGVAITSTDTEVDKKSFTFDLVPAALLANTVVVKTATPDLPGDFSGGLVQVNTLDFPQERLIKFSFSDAYNSVASTRNILASHGGGSDWLAKDDGSRALPADLKGNALARALPNTWGPRTRRAPLNETYSAAFGDRFAARGQEVGFVGGLLYKDTYDKVEFTESPSYLGVKFFDFDGTRYQRSIMLGGLLNVNYKPHPHHQISFKNDYIRTAVDKVTAASGLPNSGEFQQTQATTWNQRSLLLNEVDGQHTLGPLHKLEVRWKWYTSRSDAAEPDRKYVALQRYDQYLALRENYRTWSELSENSRGWDGDLSLPLGDAKLKAGVHHERRERTYGIDAWATDVANVQSPNYGLLTLPLDQLFLPQNYGLKKFNFISVTPFTGEYDGAHEITAYYGMAEAPFGLLGRDFRLTGGARIEQSNQFVHTVEASDHPVPITARIKKTDILPSANLTFMLDEITNLRLAYSQSVNRPELREMANVLYYDFEAMQDVLGNPSLRRAFVRNYDVRIEIFPEMGEVMAGSLFYKGITDAIEERLIPTPERYARTWFNSPTGKNYGYELELRKSLGLLGRRFRNVSITGNFTRVWSSIEYTDAKTDAFGRPVIKQGTRVMQGQSPWSLNLSLGLIVPRADVKMNVLYNRVGRRLSAVGDSRDEDVYEESRNILDLALTRRLGRVEMKFTMTNILGEDEVLTSGPHKDLFSKTKRGNAMSLSASVNL